MPLSSRRRAPNALVLLLSVLLIALTACTGGTPGDESTGPPTSTRLKENAPNIVLITTDDQTVAEMQWMPKTRKLIGEQGITFTDSLSPHPLCCPARAEILTGQFAQNNNVHSNFPPFGGYGRLDNKNTLPVWLSDAGYQTAFMGKYLNGYGKKRKYSKEVPPGWDHWYGEVKGIYNYKRFTMNVNGELQRFKGKNQSDVLAELTDKLIPEMASSDQPFFLWQSHIAPHGSCSDKSSPDRQENCWTFPVPAKRYQQKFTSLAMPQAKSPAYDEKDVKDKPPYLRKRKPLNKKQQTKLAKDFQHRVASLASTDDAVASTVEALDKAGVLDNTLILFASDNGFLLGQHRLRGKNFPYEPSVRVPMMMRGPGVPSGKTVDQTVSLVDWAPTITAAAGIEAGLTMDGMDLMPVVTGRSEGWQTILIQAGPRKKRIKKPWWWRGVRTSRYTYVEYTGGFKELYDRKRDPDELDNVAKSADYKAVRQDLARRLAALKKCAGEDCRQDFGPAPEPGG